MADVKDILGVPRSGAGPAERKPEKPKEQKLKRPKGMSREAFALMGGSNPILPAQIMELTKKSKKEALPINRPKPSSKGTVIFQYKQFRCGGLTELDGDAYGACMHTTPVLALARACVCTAIRGSGLEVHASAERRCCFQQQDKCSVLQWRLQHSVAITGGACSSNGARRLQH